MAKSAVGQVNQKLTVIEVTDGKYLCQCECGGQIELDRFKWCQRNKWACHACMDWAAYVRSLQIDRKHLTHVDPGDAQSIIRRYIRHVKLCFADEVEATAWDTFVREILSDPDGLTEEAAPTFADRLTRATRQCFEQYRSPCFQKEEATK